MPLPAFTPETRPWENPPTKTPRAIDPGEGPAHRRHSPSAIFQKNSRSVSGSSRHRTVDPRGAEFAALDSETGIVNTGEMSESKSAASFSPTSMVFAGALRNWRTSLAVALGVATATAVIVGALVVGDSMRGSLRGLTVERLGSVDSVVAPGGFFNAAEAANTLGVDENSLATVILFDRAVIEVAGDSGRRRAGAVQTIGCDEAFWRLDQSGVTPTVLPDENSIILTEALANDLAVQVGDQVTVRLPVEQAVPADSPLGRKDVQTEGIPRLKVIDILPDRGLARFSLAPAQAAPKNVFLSRELMASVLERDGQANVALSSVPIEADKLRVGIADLGLAAKRVTRSFEDDVIFDFYEVSSDQMMIRDAAAEAIESSLPADAVTQTMTYLANAIERVDESGNITHTVPYSTITAVDSSPSLPLSYALPENAKREESGGDTEPIPLAINQWTAERLEAEVGTALRVAYFEPEVKDGDEIERSFDAVVTEIVPLTEPIRRYYRSRDAVFDKPPTVYNCPELTPTVPGVTDKDSIDDWDVPFEMTREVTSDDDRYVHNHRLTPKAFLPLATGKRLFGSRFGSVTGFRIDPSAVSDLDELKTKLTDAAQPVLPELGWHIRSIRETQIAASAGTTPFDGLFLSLSFFVIFAAVMLIAMLFRLGLASRSRELGTLMALGWERRQVSKLFLTEGALIAVIGALVGIAGGIGYAVFVLAALRTFWVGAVTVPFLTFHASPISVLGGALAGLLMGMLAVWWTLRSLLQNQAISLLRGSDDSDQIAADNAPRSNRLRYVAIFVFVAALGAAIAGSMSGGQTAAGGFVGGGMLLLVAILIFVYDVLRRSVRKKQHSDLSVGSLMELARSNASRAPLRSTLTIGLMATASFLIVAIAAFRLQPTDEGTGGFDLVADSAQPLFEDLADEKVQLGLLGTDASKVTGSTFVTCRVRAGQDASCNNLYRASEPTVIGIPSRSSADLGGFHFYASGKPNDGENAWDLLARDAAGTEDDPIPMILDQNTAMWSLQMYLGVGERTSFTYDNHTLHFEVVGLLENSLLQGRLMIGESNFQKHFPDISGYRFLLVRTKDEQTEAVAGALETRLGDIGLDASDAREVLSGMMAVQNTYLRTFQSLGGIGFVARHDRSGDRAATKCARTAKRVGGDARRRFHAGSLGNIGHG